MRRGRYDSSRMTLMAIIAAICIALYFFAQPNCGPDEVVVRGAWKLVCVKGH